MRVSNADDVMPHHLLQPLFRCLEFLLDIRLRERGQGRVRKTVGKQLESLCVQGDYLLIGHYVVASAGRVAGHFPGRLSAQIADRNTKRRWKSESGQDGHATIPDADQGIIERHGDERTPVLRGDRPDLGCRHDPAFRRQVRHLSFERAELALWNPVVIEDDAPRLAAQDRQDAGIQSRQDRLDRLFHCFASMQIRSSPIKAPPADTREPAVASAPLSHARAPPRS